LQYFTQPWTSCLTAGRRHARPIGNARLRLVAKREKRLNHRRAK
jgi:hypothetical protein